MKREAEWLKNTTKNLSNSISEIKMNYFMKNTMLANKSIFKENTAATVIF